MNYLDATSVYSDATRKSPVIEFDWRNIKNRVKRYRRALPIEEGAKLATLGIMKIGANITFSANANRTAANFDVVSICRALAPNFRLHFITKITRNTVIPGQSAITDISNAMDCPNNLGLDGILVFNGSMNSYGGVEPKETIATWKIINNFKGRIFYVHTDGCMRFHQIWNDNWVSKGWADHWNKEDIVVTRDDIVYLTQARASKRIFSLTRSKSSVPVKLENICHFPIEQAVLLKPPVIKSERNIKWDLIYGGSFRSGRREDRMLKYYFGHTDLSVFMFGNVNEKHFKNSGSVIQEPYPEFGGAIANSQFIKQMNTGLATCHIVDDWYRQHWVTLRFYEALVAGTIPFVDHFADTQHRLYFEGSPIEDFIYVKTRKDLNERIHLIKNEDCANEVIDICRDTVRAHWDPKAYKEKLRKIIMRKL